MQAKHPLSPPSHLDGLPNEIMSIIFAFYASNLDPKTSPFTLGAICQRWREIAWSTPQAWSKLVAYFGLNGWSLELSATRLQLIRDWLSRSGRVPLTIDIFASWLNEEQLVRGQELVELLNSYCDRWYSLDLHLPWPALELLDASACTSSQIYHLALFADDERAFLPLSRLAPRSVDIGCIQLDFRSLDWSCVTDITISNSPVHRILRLLQLAPNILRGNFPFAGCAEEDPPAPYVQVVHSKLRTLHIEFSFDEVDQRFFENATLPALEELVLEECDIDLTANLIPFLHRSSCQLRKLSLPESNPMISCLTDVTRALPSLEEVSITSGSADVGSLGPFFQALVQHSSAEAASTAPSSPLLPSLRAFEWSGSGSFPWHIVPNFFVPLSADDGRSCRPLESITIRTQGRQGEPVTLIDKRVLLRLLPYMSECTFNFPVNLNGGLSSLLLLSLHNIIGSQASNYLRGLYRV